MLTYLCDYKLGAQDFLMLLPITFSFTVLQLRFKCCNINVTMATCPDQQTSFCSCAVGAVFQDVGARMNVSGRYYLSRQLLTQVDAQYACERVNGYLLEVDTQEEMNLIRTAIDDLLMDSIEVHIGGTFEGSSGAISSAAAPGRQLFSDWHTGHPINQGPVLCVTLYRRSRNRGLKMGSIACKKPSRRFICEI